MRELTDTCPKPMLMVGSKNLIEHKLTELPPEIDEVIIVIGYKGEVIRSYFGEMYEGRRIRYVEQRELEGTGSATWLAKDLVHGRFLILMGDDLYVRDDIERCMKGEDWVMLVESTETMASGGSVVIDSGGVVQGIEEGDHRGKPGIMNTNMFVLDEHVFQEPLVPKATGSDEFGLPQTVVAASKHLEIPLHAVEATRWIQITEPEDLTRAELQLEGVVEGKGRA